MEDNRGGRVAPDIASAREAELLPDPPGYPQRLANFENQLLRARRAAVEAVRHVDPTNAGEPGATRAPGDVPPGDVPPGYGLSTPPLGVAISGGGIRSATFALGVFQALARARLVRHIDYLSTVSGGGYFGAFLGALFRRAPELQRVLQPGPASQEASGAPSAEAEIEPQTSQAGIDLVERILGDNDHRVMRFVRDNGQYLAPAGSSDKWLFGAVLLRNWLSVALIFWTSLCFVALSLETAWLGLRDLLAGYACGGREVCLPDFVLEDSVLSPWALVPVGLLALGSLPLAWAYWFLDQRSRWLPPALGFVAALLWAAVLCRWDDPTSWLFAVPIVVWFVAGCAASAALGFAAKVAERAKAHASTGAAEVDISAQKAAQRWALNADSHARHMISQWLKVSFLWVGITGGVALADSLARYGYQELAGTGWSVSLWAISVWAVVQELARRAPGLLGLFGTPGNQKRPPLPLERIANVGAALVFFLFLGVALLIAQVLARGGPPALEGYTEECLVPSALALGFAGTMMLLLGTTRTLLNRSSHLPLYSARITRAYLGASNPRRHERPKKPASGPDPGAATRVIDGDDIAAGEYFGWGAPPAQVVPNGAPLHLVNVTVNETIDGRTRTHEADRHGTGLAIGPHGFSLGVRHHLHVIEDQSGAGPLESPTGHRVFQQPEVPKSDVRDGLSLGQWASLSGAAFSTGLGSRTRASFSFFAGIFNIRLGYWWPAPAQPTPPRVGRALLWPVWVQRYLLGEFTARFPGTANPYWYLSDGGHFENMGGYELIRRELPCIVILDGEADPKFQFEGLGNLVRKARIDFGAEIEFLSEPSDELGGRVLGLGRLEELCPEALGDAKEPGLAKAQAAVARVRYASQREGLLVYIKANRFAGWPVDLVHFGHQYPAFPQESTLDQFFDEAQWESYRKLGQLIGERLFGDAQRRTALTKRLLHPRPARSP